MKKAAIPFIYKSTVSFISPSLAAKSIGWNSQNCKDDFSLHIRNGSISVKNTESHWYTNDHCFLEDTQGALHCFSINNPYPFSGQTNQLYLFHPYLSHFIFNETNQSWEFCEFTVNEYGKTDYVGAPYVIYNENTYEYVMIAEKMVDDKRILDIGFSKDLHHFTFTDKDILPDMGYTKRDPCIIRDGDDFLIYLCDPASHGSRISVAQTKDFKSYTTHSCLFIEDGSDYGGIESPFVLKKDNLYYMFFTYAHRRYCETIVLVSTSPYHFDMDSQLTTLHGHASEIFQRNNNYFISSCGPEDFQDFNDHGIHICQLKWHQET